MLIRFSIENFLSFYNRETFSMLPGKGTLKKEHKIKPVGGVSTLKTSLLFGANASGKSNLVKAIAFGRGLVLRGVLTDQLIDYSKFRLNVDSESKNSRIEYEIQANDKNYAFGFIFNRNEVVEEWLYEITKKEEKLVYERNSSDNSFNIDPLLTKNINEEHQQFLRFVAKGTPDNQLFLRELISRKVKENVEDISDIISVYDWFLNSLKVVFPEDKYKEGIKSELVDNESLNSIFKELLKYFGTGINGIYLKDIDLNKLNIPIGVLDRIREDLLNKRTEDVRAVISTQDFTYFISKSDGDIKAQKFMTEHSVRGSSNPEYFDTKDESDGTNRIIDYIPLIIDLLKGGNVFIIDEMERSLHPNLIYDLFDLFLEFSAGVNSQLIVSTHESSLLTQKLFRKDEIWFVVKDEYGESHLYSLEDYNIRFDKEIRKDYLLGRYKAVPIIGNRYNLTNLKP
ncbi:MAG: AAA family ATPase [Bacteroidales bacterium]